MLKNFGAIPFAISILMFTGSCATLTGSPSSEAIPAPPPQSPKICGEIPPKTAAQKSFRKKSDHFIDSLLFPQVAEIHYSQRLEILELQIVILSCRASLGDEYSRGVLAHIREVRDAIAQAVRVNSAAEIGEDVSGQLPAFGDDVLPVEGTD